MASMYETAVIGGAPESGLLQRQTALDEQGYIPANETTEAKLPG